MGKRSRCQTRESQRHLLESFIQERQESWKDSTTPTLLLDRCSRDCHCVQTHDLCDLCAYPQIRREVESSLVGQCICYFACSDVMGIAGFPYQVQIQLYLRLGRAWKGEKSMHTKSSIFGILLAVSDFF